MDSPNERAGFGSNLIPVYGEMLNERLALDYGELVESVQSLVTVESRDLPQILEDSKALASTSAIVVKMRDTIARIDSYRKTEKEPYLRGGEACDAFFFKLRDQVESVRKILARRVDEYKQRQLAAERKRREEEAAEARRREDEARRAYEDEKRRQAEAEAAAARARKPERVEEHEQAAVLHRDAAELARIDAVVAEQASEDARLATLAKASKLVGERFETPERGGKVTMRQKPFVAITEPSALDLEKLRPYFSEDDLLRALRQWGRATGYKEKMPGAIVELRDTAVIR